MKNGLIPGCLALSFVQPIIGSGPCPAQPAQGEAVGDKVLVIPQGFTQPPRPYTTCLENWGNQNVGKIANTITIATNICPFAFAR